MIDFSSLAKYLLEGLGVALATSYVARRVVKPVEIIYIALVATAVFMLLDAFAPQIADATRKGSGLGIGYNLTRLEGFDDNSDTEPEPEPETDTEEPFCTVKPANYPEAHEPDVPVMATTNDTPIDEEIAVEGEIVDDATVETSDEDTESLASEVDIVGFSGFNQLFA